MTTKHGPDLTHPHGLQVYSNDKQDTRSTTHISIGQELVKIPFDKKVLNDNGEMSLTEIGNFSNTA